MYHDWASYECMYTCYMYVLIEWDKETWMSVWHISTMSMVVYIDCFLAAYDFSWSLNPTVTSTALLFLIHESLVMPRTNSLHLALDILESSTPCTCLSTSSRMAGCKLCTASLKTKCTLHHTFPCDLYAKARCNKHICKLYSSTYTENVFAVFLVPILV